MKKLNQIKTFFAISTIAFFGLTSCSKDEDPVAPQPTTELTIAAKASGTADLSILVAALVKTDLVETLKGTGPFTVFAPTNAAFTAAGITVTSINGLTTATQIAALRETLLNHVVAGKTLAAMLTDNSYIKTLGKGSASSANNLSMFVKKTTTAAGTTVKLNNNATVTTVDISASNGVIHLVDKVIFAPSIVDLVAANPNFSTLVGALGTNGLVPILIMAGPYTVFAPDNAAFTSLFTEIGTPTPAQTVNVLKYHVVNGNVLASAIPALITANTPVGTLLNTQTFTFSSTTAGVSITTNKVPVRPASKVVITDIQGDNGVIHVIDKVLLPATF